MRVRIICSPFVLAEAFTKRVATEGASLKFLSDVLGEAAAVVRELSEGGIYNDQLVTELLKEGPRIMVEVDFRQGGIR